MKTPNTVSATGRVVSLDVLIPPAQAQATAAASDQARSTGKGIDNDAEGVDFGLLCIVPNQQHRGTVVSTARHDTPDSATGQRP